MIKGVTHIHLRLIWFPSKHSNVPYSPNQFLGWDFFAASYSKTALVRGLEKILKYSLNVNLFNQCVLHIHLVKLFPSPKHRTMRGPQEIEVLRRIITRRLFGISQRKNQPWVQESQHKTNKGFCFYYLYMFFQKFSQE